LYDPQEDCGLRQPRVIGLINVASLGLVWIFGMICSLLVFTIETLIYHHHHIKEMTINDKYGIKELTINDKIDKYGTHQ
jgi:hypothetical protein